MLAGVSYIFCYEWIKSIYNLADLKLVGVSFDVQNIVQLRLSSFVISNADKKLCFVTSSCHV